jgi:flagellar hook-length control protein FliK
VPQVASDTKTYALNRPLPPSARPAPASDRAQASKFEKLLDDGAQAAGDPTGQPATDDSASPAAPPDLAQATAKAKGSKAAKTNGNAMFADVGKITDSDETGKTDKTDKTAGDAKATSEDNATAGAKTAEQAATGDILKSATDDKKPASDGNPADGVTPNDPAVAPPTDPIPMITVADAVATALAPAPGAVPPAAPAAKTVAIVATTNATPNAKPDALAALQTDAGKAADESKLAAKTALQSHSDAKPQGPASDADKDANAHARGEVAAKDNRAATMETPGTIVADASAAPKAAADAAPPLTLTAPSPTTAAAAAAPTAPTPPLPPAAAIPLAGVAIEIAGKALAGKNHFEIRLDPPELGRIEVRLDVDRDGNVTSRMIADRSDTLDLLRRDAAGLERALQDAGLKTADNSLQFSLRDHSTGQEQANGGSDTARLVVEDETLAPIDTTPRDYGRLAGRGGGLDIHV